MGYANMTKEELTIDAIRNMLADELERVSIEDLVNYDLKSAMLDLLMSLKISEEQLAEQLGNA